MLIMIVMLFSLVLFSLVLVVVANLHMALRELVISIFEHEVNRIEPAERGVEGSSEHHRFRFSFSVNALFAMLSVVVLAFMLYQGQLQEYFQNLFNSFTSLVKSSSR